MSNPYSLVFGMEPSQYISRISKTEEVTKALEEGDQRLFMVTGVRGSGKTVFMSEIRDYFDAKKDWVAIELSTERNMLEGIVHKLTSSSQLADMFKAAKINLSLLGFGIEISGVDPVTDIEVALERLLETLKKNKKNLLVVFDEAVDNAYVREMASVFQILIRDKLPINLLMTGLYENIDDLQNEKNLTFLHRAPKLHLGPLSIGTMAANYRKNLKVDYDDSVRLAQITKGYPYAFQVLGHAMCENGNNEEEAIVTLKQYLEEYVYDKIWSELSEKDRMILWGISKAETKKISEVRELTDMKSNEFAPYKRRLVRKGVIADIDGYAKTTLPLFEEYIIENYYD